MSAPAVQPFARRTVLALLVVGAGLFLGMLWWMGHGGPSSGAGGAHVRGRGLEGYAGLSALARADGIEVSTAINRAADKTPGLLILTPPAGAKGNEIEDIVVARRHIGPTLVVTPKWIATPLPRDWRHPRGWTQLDGKQPPTWDGFADDVTVQLDPKPAKGWRTPWGGHGSLPREGDVLSGSGDNLVPLVTSGDGRILAAYVDDSGFYPALNDWAGVDTGGEDDELAPLILVFEPDLLDNMGLADQGRARLALALLHAAQAKAGTNQVTFDVTFNGLGAAPNLLTLAFEPPFLAATLSLLLALLAVGWRAFCRFGPAQVARAELPPGKTMLVANSAGLIRRARRLHLVSGPYAEAVRERLAARLGLSRGRSMAETDAAIDERLARVAPDHARFSNTAAQLAATRQAAEAVRLAHRLHSIEKDLV